MTKKIQNIGVLLIIIIAVSAIYYSSNKKSSSDTPVSSTTTSTVETSSTTTQSSTVSTKTTSPSASTVKIKDAYPSSYTNSEYFFKISFPSYVKAQNYFSTFYNLSSNWKLNSAYANQGKAITSLPIFKIDQGQYASAKSTYPLYFTAEVRIGSSANTQECYTVETGYKSDGSTTINGVNFKKFSYTETVNNNYTIGESYRTIHNNKCFVIEQIKSGSNLKNENMVINTTDATLNAYYNVGESIIKTFKFTK